jgi:TonB family protein
VKRMLDFFAAPKKGRVLTIALACSTIAWTTATLRSTAQTASPQAASQPASKAERKLLTRVEPEYPPVLKVRQIGGTVRLELSISPKGTVKSATILGGNPVLAESAVTAVKKWLYAPSDVTSTAQVSLEFNPYR